MRNVPGRKTDVADAQWGAQLLEHGLVRPSFIPERPVREMRDLTRYRKSVIEERGRETQRLHKVLEDAGIKLASFTSSVLTKSGRQMIDALIAGQREPEVLAEMAKGRMRVKIPQLQDALAGCFNAHHARLCATMLDRIDHADRVIDELTEQIEVLLDPHEAAVHLLCGIPGVSNRTAQVILAEIGTDMSRFPTAGHLASWAGMCPGNNESAGKHRSGRTRHGSKWLRIALVEAGQAAGRSKNTYLSAHYHRIRGRRGPRRAAVAVGHSILVIAWHLLSTGELYNELGGDYFDRRRTSHARQRRLVAQLEAMGLDVNHHTRRRVTNTQGSAPKGTAAPHPCPEHAARRSMPEEMSIPIGAQPSFLTRSAYTPVPHPISRHVPVPVPSKSCSDRSRPISSAKSLPAACARCLARNSSSYQSAISSYGAIRATFALHSLRRLRTQECQPS